MNTDDASATPSDDLFVVSGRVRIRRSEFEITYVHSSGPGGQNVNKVATKARLRWNVLQSPSLPEDVRRRFIRRYGSRLTKDGELLITSQRFRRRERNAADCLERLRELLLNVAVPPRPRKPTKPSRGSIERRLERKRRTSERKRRRNRPRFDE